MVVQAAKPGGCQRCQATSLRRLNWRRGGDSSMAAKKKAAKKKGTKKKAAKKKK